jgi:hypothetical protein
VEGFSADLGGYGYGKDAHKHNAAGRVNRSLRPHPGPSGPNRQTVIRPRVDPPQQRRAACVIRRPVEGVESRFKQRIGDQRPVCRLPSSRSNSLIANFRNSSAPASASAGFFGVFAAVERAFLIVQSYHIFRLWRGAFGDVLDLRPPPGADTGGLPPFFARAVPVPWPWHFI